MTASPVERIPDQNLDDVNPLIDRALTIAKSNAVLPPILRTEQQSPPLARGPWYKTIAPAYLGIFVWAPFFDSLWTEDLTRFPLPWLIGSAGFASLLCFGLLYYIPASLGFQTRRPLGIVAASTFGTLGSEWIMGVAIGVAHILWYAVAIDYAVDSTLLGLRAAGLIAAGSLSSWDLGSIALESPVYLTTALFWIYITGTAGLWKLPGVVVALMRIYAPIALLLLTAVAFWQFSSLPLFHLETAALIVEKSIFTDRWRGHGSAVQLMTGFFALAGLAGVDWGARVERRRDVLLGGLSGIVLAASWTAIMSLVVIAGSVDGVYHQFHRFYVAGVDDSCRLSFRWAVYHGIGGIPGGAILILFGLAALAPACYSAWNYSQRLSTHWPRFGQSGWTWAGGAIAFVLGATSYANRLELIFSGMGDVFAPAIGAMAGDWLRSRGTWAGLRPGVNRTGVIAWGAGFAIALGLEADAIFNSAPTPSWRSTSICGFASSFIVYWLLAGLGRERPAVPIARQEIGE